MSTVSEGHLAVNKTEKKRLLIGRQRRSSYINRTRSSTTSSPASLMMEGAEDVVVLEPYDTKKEKGKEKEEKENEKENEKDSDGGEEDGEAIAASSSSTSLEVARSHEEPPEPLDVEYWTEENVAKLVYVQSMVRKWLVRRKLRSLAMRYLHSPQAKDRRHRNEVVREIFKTEETYVECLQLLVDRYLKRFMEAPDTVITGAQSLEILSNVEVLLQCATTLLRKLRTSDSSRFEQAQQPAKARCTVGSIFLEMAPFLKIYVPYINNYQHAVSTLATLQRTNAAFSSLLAECDQSTGSGLNLMSFLIMPVQRIPRYVMLLGDLLKHTDAEHVDRDNIEKALAAIEEVASSLNEAQRSFESTERLLRCQQRLKGADFLTLIEPHRHWIREGAILQRCARLGPSAPYKECYYFLFNDILITATPQGSHTDALNFFAILHLMEVTLNPITSSEADGGELTAIHVRWKKAGDTCMGMHWSASDPAELEELLHSIKRQQRLIASPESLLNSLIVDDAMKPTLLEGVLSKRHNIFTSIWHSRHIILKGSSMFYRRSLSNPSAPCNLLLFVPYYKLIQLRTRTDPPSFILRFERKPEHLHSNNNHNNHNHNHHSSNHHSSDSSGSTTDTHEERFFTTVWLSTQDNSIFRRWGYLSSTCSPTMERITSSTSRNLAIIRKFLYRCF